jgi:hypothetical protein
MRSCLHRTPGNCLVPCHQSRWAILSKCRLVNRYVYEELVLTHCLPGEDLAINLWDLGSGRRIKKMTGHTASIYSLAISEESSLLVSGGADWTVRCWDVKGAGGPAVKPRENGSMGNGDSAVRGYGDGDNNET